MADITFDISPASVVPVALDTTLSRGGLAADAAAVGAALALKADTTELPKPVSVNGIEVNAQGRITIGAGDIKTDNDRSIQSVIDGMNGETLPLSDDDSTPIKDAIMSLDGAALKMGDGDDTTIKDAVVAAKTTVVDYYATISVNAWTGSVAPFTASVTIDGLLSTDKAFVAVSMVNAAEAMRKAMRTAFASVYKAETGNDTLTLTAEKLPESSINIIVRVVR